MIGISSVTARVPAKVNLQLSIGPLRADGYHDVVTVYHAVTLFDEVTVAPAEHDSVTVTGEGAGAVPADGRNLAVHAARALAKAAGPGCQDLPGLEIRISKRIPVAAGLAGGSADAAATLVACNALWQAGLSQAELCEIAADVGSDVTFALLGGTAVGVGRGERVTPALAQGTYHWVLAFAAVELSTAKVYAAFDRLHASRGASGASPPPGRWDGADRTSPDSQLLAALRSGDPAGVGSLLSNDLQPAAISLQPGLRRALAAGREQGALGAVVSGSGPTCAYLAKDARHARQMAVALAGEGVCRAVVHVTGPAPGATVISIAAGPG